MKVTGLVAAALWAERPPGRHPPGQRPCLAAVWIAVHGVMSCQS